MVLLDQKRTGILRRKGHLAHPSFLSQKSPPFLCPLPMAENQVRTTRTARKERGQLGQIISHGRVGIRQRREGGNEKGSKDQVFLREERNRKRKENHGRWIKRTRATTRVSLLKRTRRTSPARPDDKFPGIFSQNPHTFLEEEGLMRGSDAEEWLLRFTCFTSMQHMPTLFLLGFCENNQYRGK